MLKKININPYSLSYKKINSKCIPQLNVKPETMKLVGKGRKKIETLGQARIFKI